MTRYVQRKSYKLSSEKIQEEITEQNLVKKKRNSRGNQESKRCLWVFFFPQKQQQKKH